MGLLDSLKGLFGKNNAADAGAASAGPADAATPAAPADPAALTTNDPGMPANGGVTDPAPTDPSAQPAPTGPNAPVDPNAGPSA